MALTKFGVVYSTNSAQIRRFIYPSTSDAELNLPWAGPGEAMVQVSRGPYVSTAAYQAAVNNAVLAASGKSPGDPRCCVLDITNTVVAVIHADAGLDTISGKSLVQAYAAIPIGSTYNPATGLFTSPPQTIPAGTFIKATGTVSLTQTIIPGAVIPKP